MSGNMNFGTTRMTKEEFNQCANIKTIIKNITIAAIITYVIGAISLITNVILGGNIFGLLDVIIVIGLGVPRRVLLLCTNPHCVGTLEGIHG